MKDILIQPKRNSFFKRSTKPLKNHPIKKYQKETKSSKMKKKAAQAIKKESISVKQLVNRPESKKVKRRPNSLNPLKKSKFMKSRGARWNEFNEGNLTSFGSQVVSSSKLRSSLIRTGKKKKEIADQNENNFGKNFYMKILTKDPNAE